jgi:hypothetical protein
VGEPRSSPDGMKGPLLTNSLNFGLNKKNSEVFEQEQRAWLA